MLWPAMARSRWIGANLTGITRLRAGSKRRVAMAQMSLVGLRRQAENLTVVAKSLIGFFGRLHVCGGGHQIIFRQRTFVTGDFWRGGRSGAGWNRRWAGFHGTRRRRRGRDRCGTWPGGCGRSGRRFWRRARFRRAIAFARGKDEQTSGQEDDGPGEEWIFLCRSIHDKSGLWMRVMEV